MRFITITTLAVLASLGARPSDAQTLYTCGEGTVRSVRTIIEMVAPGPVVSTFDIWGEPQQHVVMPPHEARRAHVVTVQLANVEYSAEAFADEPENFDPTQLEEGDRVATCISYQQMILDRDKGDDFRATIIRQKSVKQRPSGTK